MRCDGGRSAGASAPKEGQEEEDLRSRSTVADPGIRGCSRRPLGGLEPRPYPKRAGDAQMVSTLNLCRIHLPLLKHLLETDPPGLVEDGRIVM